ncbi:tape measure protein [Bombilactobacillus bombi]|nr:tape measure protein [Bombilactobacillus bombi]
MPETYSVKAVLSAVDNNFSSTVKNAIESIGGITKKTGVFGKSASSSFKQASDSATGFGSSVARLSTAIGITQAVSSGINAMKNSMGGAVSRMDTLANSSRVFKNMGFAAGDTAKMMEQLQASIKGLPTPLDQAVKGVQMIASSTGDIGRSQAIWAALNDSILGFGGSTADVNNAVLQLSQAFSNGTIDGMTWISMMNSQMGPVLTAIAKKMGITTGELKEGLSKGKISVQEFQDALIELDKNGGGGLESLHNIALTATGGIATSMQNAKTSVTRGLTEMLKGFDTFTQTVTGLNLSQIINQIGTAVEGVLDKVASNIPKAAGYFKKLGLTADQSKRLITGFVSAAMGIGAIVAVTPVIGSVISALGGLFKAAVQVKDIFISLSSFLISPWGLATVAIGLVVTALVELYAKFQPLHDAVNGTVSAFTQGFGQAIPQMLGYLNQMFQNLQTQLGLIGTAIQQQIGGSLHAINVQSLADDFSSAFGDLIGIINTFVNAITQVIVGFIQVGTLQSVWTAIGAVINAVQTIIFTVVNEIGQFITNSSGVEGTGSGWQVVGNAIGTVVNWIAQAITAVANFISQSTGGLSQVIQFIQGVINAVVQMVAGFVNTGAVQAVWDAIKAVIFAIWTILSTLIGTVQQFTGTSGEVGDAAVNWQAVGTAIGNVAVFLAQVITAIADFITKISDFVSQMTPMQQLLVEIGGAAGLIGGKMLISSGAVQDLAKKMLGLGENSDKAKESVKGMSGESSNLGTQIGIAAAGIGIAAGGISLLAQTGDAGTNALEGITLATIALAGAFALLGPSLTKNAVGIVAFGLSVTAIGAGIAIASAGIAVLITAFTGLVKVMSETNTSSDQLIDTATDLGIAFGTMMVSALAAIVAGLGKMAPMFMNTLIEISGIIVQNAPILAQDFLTLIIEIVSVVAQNLPQLFESGTQLVVNFIKGITEYLGQVIPVALQLLATFIDAVAQNIQPVISAGLDLLVQFLEGLAQGLPQVMGAVADVISAFLEGLADNIKQIIDAGADLLVNFLNGIASVLHKVVDSVVNVITKFVKALADNIGKIIDAGIYLLKKFVLGVVRAIPKVVDVGVKVVNEFVYAVGYALGKVLTSGQKLIAMFAKGIWDGVSGSRKAGDANAKAIADGIKNTNLYKNGVSIINGFIQGVKDTWNNVKGFFSGIGDWIKQHKGPIQYDRKLLIPAGNAIMEGLNSGLVSSFKDVQNNISSMAKAIAQSANSNFSKNINAFNANLTSGTVSHAISGSLDVTKQPMSLNLVMGDNTYCAYVDDITKQQDINLSLGRF